MIADIDQYKIETTLSTRLTEDIIMKSINWEGEVKENIKLNIFNTIKQLNKYKHIDNTEIFNAVFTILLKDNINQPIQSISTQIGKCAGFNDDPIDAFDWGWTFLKECKNSDLYTLNQKNNNWFVFPEWQITEATRRKISKLQYLPPMKQRPLKWTDNYNGGWLWENKHLVLGNRFNRHERPLAYDAINKLQRIPWEIDPDTYLFETQTNTCMNKKQFLSVIDQYLGKHFYFVWRYDKRGRSYSSGYDLNLQTNEYGKALLSLHNKELITNIPNLHIAIANHAGKDKLTWSKRIDWVSKQNINKIKWKEPILGRKAIRALEDTKNSKPTGYVMSIDATSSGIQIMAVLSGCKKTAKLVNCINPNIRYDLYTTVAKMMNKKLTKPVPRKIMKKVVMTHFFNSTLMPKTLLSSEELIVFYEVMEGLLPGAEKIMHTINNCWNYNEDYHAWIMPDKHTVYIPVVESVDGVYSDSEFGKIPLRTYHKIKSNNYRSLCPNVIHSIDGYIAREMVRRCKFQLSHVHDCFVFNPNYLQKVTTTYKEIMAEIAKSNLLANILSQITKSAVTFNKHSADLDKNILKSEYMLS
jgi:hypothetical protein